ncbi:Autophagy-related protein 2 B [Nymphon striatum]|nr:Autophagy-related protein 2 B [Nymphon striatum]
MYLFNVPYLSLYRFELKGFLDSFYCFASPMQVHSLLILINNFMDPGTFCDINQNQSKPPKIFTEPKKIFLFLEVISEFKSDGVKNETPPHIMQHKMEPADYERIQFELHKKECEENMHFRGLHTHQGWSSPPDVVLDLDQMSQFASESGTNKFDSNSAMDSSIVTSVTTNTDTPQYEIEDQNQKGQSRMGSNEVESSGINNSTSCTFIVNTVKKLMDSEATSTQFSCELDNFLIFILHEDVLDKATDGKTRYQPQSVTQMKAISDDFFRKVKKTEIVRDIDATNSELDKIFQLNHLRFFASSLSAVGSRNSAHTSNPINVTIETNNFAFLECMFNQSCVNGVKKIQSEYYEILVPTRQSKKFEAKKKLLTVNISQIYQSLKLAQNSKNVNTNVQVYIGDCTIELDISIIDRIHALLHGEFFQIKKLDPFENFGMMQDATSSANSSIVLSIASNMVEFKLRFPIPDLRPLHDFNRLQWWKRSIRSDIMTFKMKNTEFTTKWDSVESPSKLELTSEDIHVFFQESQSSPQVSIMRSTPDITSYSMTEKGFDFSRLVIRFNADVPVSVLEENKNDLDPDELNPDSMDMLMRSSEYDSDSSPFWTRKFFCKTLLSEKTGKSADEENLVVPLEKEAMSKFIEETADRSKMLLEIYLPNLNVQLPNKHLYEVIYNRELEAKTKSMHKEPRLYRKVGVCGLERRLMSKVDRKDVSYDLHYNVLSEQVILDSGKISNDLLLWEPSVSVVPDFSMLEQLSNSKPSATSDLSNQFFQQHIIPNMSIYKSLKNDSSSDSDDSNCMYQSTFIDSSGKKRKRNDQSMKQLFHEISISLTTSNGQFSICCPIRDSSGNVMPGLHGQIVLKVKDALVFIVSGYESEPQSGFIISQVNQLTLYHKGLTKSATFSDVTEPVSSSIPSELNTILHMSDGGITFDQREAIFERPDLLDMLTLAVQFQKRKKEVVLQKHFKVALRLSRSTLKHNFTVSSQLWLNQLMDFFDVADYPIAGYECLPVVNELHLMFSECVVDYKPFYMPLRALLTLNTLCIMSNVTPSTSTSSLKFLFKDTNLFLTNKPKQPYIDLKNDFACVITVPFFEIAIKTSADENKCKFDLQAANDVFQISTCADSCRALCDLIMYIAEDKDLQNEPTSLRKNRSKPNVSDDFHTTPPLHKRSKSEVEKCEALIADALAEENIYKSCESVDEVAEKKKSNKKKSNTHMTDIFCSSEEEYSDEEFCFLENDPGTGIMPHGGEPEIRILTDESIRIKDNYFPPPVGTSNILKAPAHFPVPVTSFSLRQMNIYWLLYGGNDFEPVKDCESSGNDDDRSCKSTYDPRYHRSSTSSPAFSSASSSDLYTSSTTINSHAQNNKSKHGKISIRNLGGLNRDESNLMKVEFLKVKSQYDLYPSDTREASRQVLMINDIVISDHLKSSNINKFFYQYYSESRPRQEARHMVELKILYVRPEPGNPTEECEIKTSALPIRLNIDQDTLLFLENFFKTVFADAVEKTVDVPSFQDEAVARSDNSKVDSPPESGFNPPKRLPNTVDLGEDGLTNNLISPIQEHSSLPENRIFIRRFVFSPELFIRLDYLSKGIDLNKGTILGLFMGIADLNNSEIVLKPIVIKSGILGVDNLIQHVFNEWFSDIFNKQLPYIIQGLGPIYPLKQMLEGIGDFFMAPFIQYRKDGRIMLGFQRSASSLTRTFVASMEITNRFLAVIQGAAQFTYDLISPTSIELESVSDCPPCPADITEGLAGAYNVMKEGCEGTARNVAHVVRTGKENKGVTGLVGGVARQLPPALIRQLVLCTKAASNVVGGVKNQLSEDARNEATEKWRQPNQ